MTCAIFEKGIHFFFNCRFVRNLLERYFDNIFGDPIDIPKLLFKGHLAENNKEILYVNLEVILFCYFIFNAKSRKKIPSFGTISIMIAGIKNQMLNYSIFYRKIVSWIKKHKSIGKITNHMENLNKFN